jgi:hypothetical protein
MLTESPCLPSVYDFLNLSDKLSFARVNRYWRFVSTTCPSAVIDTVGFDISVSRLVNLVKTNSSQLEILRVSIRESEIDFFVSEFLSNMHKFSNLRKLAIFVSAPDGSVRIPIRDLSRIDMFDNPLGHSGISSLILQFDPTRSKPTQKLIAAIGENLNTIAFLRGSGLSSSDELVCFLTKTVPRASSIFLGHCDTDINMDDVVPHIFANRNTIKYLQWSNASASIGTLQFVQSKVSECDFDGLGFLMFLL